MNTMNALKIIVFTTIVPPHYDILTWVSYWHTRFGILVKYESWLIYIFIFQHSQYLQIYISPNGDKFFHYWHIPLIDPESIVTSLSSEVKEIPLLVALERNEWCVISDYDTLAFSVSSMSQCNEQNLGLSWFLGSEWDILNLHSIREVFLKKVFFEFRDLNGSVLGLHSFPFVFFHQYSIKNVFLTQIMNYVTDLFLFFYWVQIHKVLKPNRPLYFRLFDDFDSTIVLR